MLPFRASRNSRSPEVQRRWDSSVGRVCKNAVLMSMPSTSHELVGDIPCDDCLNRRGSLMLTSKEIRVHVQSPVAQYVPLLSSWHLG